MSQSQDPNHFFQTSQALAETTRRAKKAKNEHGRPIRLQSKALAITADPQSLDAVYVAESSGIVRRILPHVGTHRRSPFACSLVFRLRNCKIADQRGCGTIQTGESTHIYRGPAAPLTCLTVSPDGDTIFAGSWDKSIWSWNTSTAEQQRWYKGHTDFVKTLITARVPSSGHDKPSKNDTLHNDVLISGSTDTTVIIWSLTTGHKLHTLNGHGRGVLGLAIDPVSLTSSSTSEDVSASDTSASTTLELLTGSSAREILVYSIPTSTLNINDSPSSSILPIQPLDPPILIHETSITTLHFPTVSASTLGSMSDPEPPDLWTASLDGNAHCLARHSPETDSQGPISLPPPQRQQPPRQQNEHRWAASSPHTTLTHPSPKHHINSLTSDVNTNTVVTAGRDEDVHVWDASTGSLRRRYKGHFDEVTGLAIINVALDDLESTGNGAVVGDGQDRRSKVNGRSIVSVSLDGTVRMWGLSAEELAKEDFEEAGLEDEEIKDEGANGVITAEEEAELDALMQEDDEDAE